MTPALLAAKARFDRAREALLAGDLSVMIDQMTRGMEIVDAVDRASRPRRKVRPRKSAG